MKTSTYPTTGILEKTIGKKIRFLRLKNGLSQEKLANALCEVTHPHLTPCASMTFQQIQKYELALNHININRLMQFSILFGVPISYFFDKSEDNKIPETKRKQSILLSSVVDNFFKIKSEETKIIISKLIKHLANKENQADD